MSILQRLYDSEINCGIELNPGHGFRVWMRWPNQYTTGNDRDTWAECESWLESTARALYPESKFARNGK